MRVSVWVSVWVSCACLCVSAYLYISLCAYMCVCPYAHYSNIIYEIKSILNNIEMENIYIYIY